MIPEIWAWGINHTLNFNPNPGGNNCMTCSCSLPHVCRENMQASSSNHPGVPGTGTLAENLCGCGLWAVLSCPWEQEIPSELFYEWWDGMWVCCCPLCTCVNISSRLVIIWDHLNLKANKQKSLFVYGWMSGVFILNLCSLGTMCQISLLTWLYLLTLNLTLEVTLEELFLLLSKFTSSLCN